MNQYQFIKFPVSEGRDRESAVKQKRDTGPQTDEGVLNVGQRQRILF
jgi:hypothetical protein